MGLRPESSVSVSRDEYGELVCDGERPGPVIHRTPEELGIPRVIAPDPPKRLSIWPDGWPVEAHRTAKRHAERHGSPRLMGANGSPSVTGNAAARAAREAPLRMIKGVAVRMPADAVMGAEMIDLLAGEAERESLKEGKMPRGKYGVSTPPEVAAQIVANVDGLRMPELAVKFGVSISTVSALRLKAKQANGWGKVRKPQKNATALARPGNIQPIAVDPGPPGTASSLIGALAARDAAAAPAVRLELTEGEVVGIVARMSGEQRSAFLAAGLKAAILG